MDRDKYEDRYPDPDAEILWEFERDKKATNIDTSARVWASGARTYATWLHENEDTGILEASPRQVRRYFAHVSEKYAINTQGGKYHGVQHLYEWLVNTEQLGENPAERWSREALGIGVPTEREEREQAAEDDDSYYWLSKSEVELLWERENLPGPRLRNEIAVKLLWYTGLRTEELASVRIEPDDEHSLGLFRDEGRIRVANAKVSGTRDVWYPRERLELLLADWLDFGGRDALSPYAEGSQYLLVTDQSERMRPSHISRIVKNAAQNAGINEVVDRDVNGKNRWKVRGHVMRHSMATYHANILGTPIPVLADALGHRKLTTTRRYIHEDESAVRKAMQRVD
jgi:integrase/recombinase XerD